MPSWGDDPATKDALRSDHEVCTIMDGSDVLHQDRPWLVQAPLLIKSLSVNMWDSCSAQVQAKKHTTVPYDVIPLLWSLTWGLVAYYAKLGH